MSSEGDTTNYYIKTWFDFHDAVDWQAIQCADQADRLPLTPVKITVMGAVLKEAGYRGAMKYGTAIKQLHIAHGYTWSDQLDLALARFNRSTTRGAGPSRQSEPLPFDKVAELNLEDALTNTKYPVNPSAMVTLSTFFLLRELEVAAARVEDLMINTQSLEVKMRLSMSKNDPMAKGCERAWRCTCDSAHRRAHASCPYHAARHHLDMLKRIWKDGATGDFPLFPDAEGHELNEDRMVEFVEAIAQLCGEPVRNRTGQRRYGRHSFRSTGAVWLTSMGIEIAKVQILGRWNCGLVLHYCRLAPLKTVTEDYKKGRAAKQSDAELKKLNAKTAKLQGIVKRHR